jgi:hypothetical protein
MSNKMNANAAVCMAMAMYASSFKATDDPVEILPKIKKEKQPPKGCKFYYFDGKGDFSHQKSESTIFECTAISDKHAQAKFLKRNPQ